MPRTLAERTIAGVACAGMLFAIALPSAGIAKQSASPVRTTARITHSTAPPRRHRFVITTSCTGDAEGAQAFDSGTAFTTNNETVFGIETLAAAEASGVFEGYQSQVCDADSAIGAGSINAVDSGKGNTPNGASYSFIGAGEENSISNQESFIGAGYANSASGDEAFIGAGDDNRVSESASAISGGTANVISNEGSFIGAGGHNQITAGSSFVGAGGFNVVSGMGSFIGAGGILTAAKPFNQVSGTDSFIGAGDQNSVSTNEAFIGSGALNTIGSAANYSVVAGGYGNTMAGQKASLGGGEQNDVTGSFATIPGGYRNEALGNESFAAGSQAEARYAGSFVWSDYASSEKPQTDSAINEFVARASGGVYFFSNATSSVGVHLGAGSGTWSSLSDRNAKTGIVPLDDASILAKVASLPISAWQYKTERGVRHVGPMAQDFYAAFGVGEDDRHITSIDEDGIALAAIKALHGESRRKDGEIVHMLGQIARLNGENARLQSRLAGLEERSADLSRRFDALDAARTRPSTTKE